MKAKQSLDCASVTQLPAVIQADDVSDGETDLAKKKEEEQQEKKEEGGVCGWKW